MADRDATRTHVPGYRGKGRHELDVVSLVGGLLLVMLSGLLLAGAGGAEAGDLLAAGVVGVGLLALAVVLRPRREQDDPGREDAPEPGDRVAVGADDEDRLGSDDDDGRSDRQG